MSLYDSGPKPQNPKLCHHHDDDTHQKSQETTHYNMVLGLREFRNIALINGESNENKMEHEMDMAYTGCERILFLVFRAACLVGLLLFGMQNLGQLWDAFVKLGCIALAFHHISPPLL